MSNQIRLKRASGSDPSASDLVLGEPAVRTDTGEIFLKKDDGSIAKVAGGIDDGDKGDITVSNDGGTFTIDSGVIDNANVASNAAIAGSKISPDFGSQDVTTTGDLKIDNQTKSLQVGNVTADNYSQLITVAASSARGFTVQHNSVTVLENLQGTTNQHLVLGDVDNNNGNTLFGISLTTSGSTVTRLSLSGSGNLDVHNNITLGGTVDGRDIASDGSKLDGIESGATADQTASEILTLIKTVDGSGSGLDADTLDGVSSGSFVRSDADDTLNGQYTISDSANEKLVLAGSNSPLIRFQEGTTNKAYIQWNNGGFLEIGNQESNELIRLASGSNGLAFVEGGSERTVYHTGNLSVGDGGLTQNNFTNADHSKLNGIESGATADQSASEIVALIADQTIAPSTIDMEDNEKIKLGASDDLEIFHGSNISTIHDNSGDLRIQGDLIRIQREASGENYLYAIEGGEVKLFYDGIERFRTGSGGNITFGTDAGGSDHRGRLYFKTEGGTVRALFDPLAQKFQHYDNTYATFGNDHDLRIFHNGSHSRIHDSGTGKLQLGSDTEVEILNGSFNESMAKFIPNGSVELYEDNTKRLETSSYGSITTGVHSVSNGILELKAAIATSHTITTDYNALAVDPTINNGITVTVPSGAVWAIV